MRIPVLYNVRSVMQRPVSTALTALGIALVVAVFIGMLALANGFRVALARTGVPENMLILRRGADSELSSGLARDAVSIITASPHVALGSDGRPLVSPEVFVLIPLPRPRPDSNAVANVVARGVSDRVWDVRANVRVTAGQRPAPGRAEICVDEKLVTGGEVDLAPLRTYPCEAFLVDAGSGGEYGGTGRPLPWATLRDRFGDLLAGPCAARPGKPWVLAGGLSPENVERAIAEARPNAVDVASGVESAPGRKDPEKVAAFVEKARRGLLLAGA